MTRKSSPPSSSTSVSSPFLLPSFQVVPHPVNHSNRGPVSDVRGNDGIAEDGVDRVLGGLVRLVLRLEVRDPLPFVIERPSPLAGVPGRCDIRVKLERGVQEGESAVRVPRGGDGRRRVGRSGSRGRSCERDRTGTLSASLTEQECEKRRADRWMASLRAWGDGG